MTENNQTPEALLLLGKLLKKQGKLEDAIQHFARAVELKMETCETEVFADLAQYLMEYADALLIKEETNTADFLSSLTTGKCCSDSDDEGTIPRLDSGRIDQPVPAGAFDEGQSDDEDEDSFSDLQLAWESFEHARLCLKCFEEDQQKNKDLSFVHCRLGDIQALQEQFSASVADYAQAVEYALKGNESHRQVAGMLISLSQAIQTYITSPEMANGSVEVGDIVKKVRKDVFVPVVNCFAVESFKPSVGEENSLAHLAKDGFLLAQSLLEIAATEEDTNSEGSMQIKTSIEELSANAQDCLTTLNMKSSSSVVNGIVPGVTSTAFPVSVTSNDPIVTVAVKRKVNAVDEEGSKKVIRDETQRAEKTKLVD